MYKNFIIFWFLFFSSFGTAFSLDLPPRSYQDIFVNGHILAKGYGPDCTARYEAIKRVLDLYERPITILDIGAAEGYFSFRAAFDYNACTVMISDPKYKDNLLETLCFENTELNRVVLLSKRISANELTQLAECEHFDVVLALNVIHHFKEDWKEAYEAIRKLGDHIIIETPPNGDKGACGQPILTPINECLDQESYTLLGQFKRQTDPDKVDRLIWISNPVSTSTTSKWIPGIHLTTFRALNGRYPTDQALHQALGRFIFE